MVSVIDRRMFCGGLLLGGLAAALPARASEPLIVTDMAGRKVRLPATPRRIILLEARDIVSMSLLHPDPAALVVGWAAVDRIDSDVVRDGIERKRQIPVVGKQTPDTISFEGLISLTPDLVVANLYMAPQGDKDLLVERLESAGVPVIFSDLSSNASSERARGVVADFHEQMRMWGEVLGAADKAASYTAFVDAHLTRVVSCVAGAAPVTTYLEVQSTVDDCCWAAGSKVWGELLELAGGRTLPGVTAPWFQKLDLEYLVSTPSDVYIASGGGWSAGGRPSIGPGFTAAQGKEGLQRLIARTGFDQLSSVRNGRVHGIWSGLISIPPFNILFVEQAAKWLLPERCSDIDPAATLAEINQRFLSTPIRGPLWASLRD
ncbi:MAG TPA: ABC transporter substrate-binding protein [Mesorhizobium sp.]|jgi:iron complex transport system substrate-binding protein|uniref:ABC transporter substrate-binding protein n=1 Tax=Mesorhizobium sp. TaxID=1871066 RepID=UPI002DDD7501|nr:ABC transporter substrate-binding protein [Mesorhizobium sp.]HEV2502609.1 ABC transporter substrate-binding protein [Mesorhizobium sp.]